MKASFEAGCFGLVYFGIWAAVSFALAELGIGGYVLAYCLAFYLTTLGKALVKLEETPRFTEATVNRGFIAVGIMGAIHIIDAGVSLVDKNADLNVKWGFFSFLALVLAFELLLCLRSEQP